MANELPYFRFTVQAWQNGKIDIERYELKGLFISICGYYWIQDCSITKAMLTKKYSDAKSMIEELINLEIIKHFSENDSVEISFLDEQFDLLSDKRKKRQQAGSKGGYAKHSNAKAKRQQKGSYKDKDKENNKDKDNNNPGLVNPFSDSFLKGSWQDWKDYLKSEKKKPIKLISTENTALKKLFKLAGGDEKTAIEMLDTSISSGWQSFIYAVPGQQGGQVNGGRPMTNGQKLTHMVEHGGYMAIDENRWVKIAGTTVDGHFKLDPDSEDLVMFSGGKSVRVQPSQNYASNVIYELAPGKTIQGIHQHLLEEKRKITPVNLKPVIGGANPEKEPALDWKKLASLGNVKIEKI